MGFFGNPDNSTLEENSRWCQLRAIEWGKFPLFISQPLVPILFYYFTWWKIIILILIVSYLWLLFRYNFVSPKISEIGVILVKLKWPISIIMGAIFIFQSNYLLAGLASFWQLVTFILIFLTGRTKIGILEKKFAEKIGLIDLNQNN